MWWTFCISGVRIATWLLMAAGLMGLANCGGNPREPAGPDMPIFSLSAVPGQITPAQNAQLYLDPIQPNEFETLQGLMVLFRSHDDWGFFDHDTSRVDTNAVSRLNPAVWYSYVGSESSVTDTIYGECIDANFNLVAWDSCTVKIVSSP